jgi:hypothetical protein
VGIARHYYYYYKELIWYGAKKEFFLKSCEKNNFGIESVVERSIYRKISGISHFFVIPDEEIKVGFPHYLIESRFKKKIKFHKENISFLSPIKY